MADLKLHDLELSGNCYKVRLFCALLGLQLDMRAGRLREQARTSEVR